jgi:hypothetical protein
VAIIVISFQKNIRSIIKKQRKIWGEALPTLLVGKDKDICPHKRKNTTELNETNHIQAGTMRVHHGDESK